MADSPSAANPVLMLHKVARVLEAAKVPWAAIGALAVAYHGPVRGSLDADALITLKGSDLDLDALDAKLRSKGWKVETRMGEPGDPLGFVIRIHDAAGNQVDLIGGIRKLDVGFFERAIHDRLEGKDFRIASAEDTIALKVFAGSPLDLEDAKGIFEVKGKKIDTQLVARLCRQFGRTEEKRCSKLLNQEN